jgi:hypothetical protein
MTDFVAAGVAQDADSHRLFFTAANHASSVGNSFLKMAEPSPMCWAVSYATGVRGWCDRRCDPGDVISLESKTMPPRSRRPKRTPRLAMTDPQAAGPAPAPGKGILYFLAMIYSTPGS